MADIDKELRDIKNAVYGREVRGSIHDGIKKINEEVEDSTETSEQAKHQVENIQEQVNNLVVSGDSSVEAAQARVDKDNHNYSTLKERLDTEQQKFETQLTEKANNLDLANAQFPLQITTYLGDNQITHPKVIYFENGWNGFNFWMGYTAYPQGNALLENPCIAVSNDGVNWTIPNGMENPIADTPEEGYNSDSHIFMVDDTMHYWYREVGENKIRIWEHISDDGVDWSNRRLVQEFEKDVKDWISPAVVYEDGKYKVWFGDVGRKIKYIESTDGENWVNERELNIDFASMGLIPWHYDVEKTDLGYEFLITAHKQGESYNETELYYVFSDDNLNFSEPVKVIGKTKKPNTFDNQAIYRSCLVKVDGLYYVYYSGWSKENRYRALGLSVGSDINNLYGMTRADFWDIELNGHLRMKDGAFLRHNALQFSNANGDTAIFYFTDINYLHLRDRIAGEPLRLYVGDVFSEGAVIGDEVKVRSGAGVSRFAKSDLRDTIAVMRDTVERPGGLEVRYVYFDGTPENTMNAVEGAIRYNKTIKKHQGYDGEEWHNLY